MFDLFALVMLARETGDARELWLRRGTCHRHCWQAAAYEIRGLHYLVLRRYKVSPYVLARRDVPDRRVEGRAWAAADVPVGNTLMVGCDHEQNDAVFGPGPSVTSWARIT